MLTSAVIVGGSLSGLIHGLYLKRQGVNVTILEQDVNEERSSHNAGIQISDNVNKFLRQNDITGARLAFQSQAMHWSLRTRPKVYSSSTATRYWTNWGYVYRILRANFDGYVSKACPDPPAARPSDGQVQYLTGKRVTGMQYADGLVSLDYVDATGKEGSLSSELVIGADGNHSTVRKLVQAPQAEPENYAGYFAWRGSVPVRDVSKETADFFLNGICFDLLGNKSYILCYVIPTDHGSFESGELLLNWLLYQDLKEGSPEEEAIFTDIHGRRAQRTIPQGLANPIVWETRRSALVQRMIPPFAELLTKSPTPFVTKIFEALGSQASFCEGHVILVGDALASYRPNIGRATDQAAAHCLTLAEVLQGKKSVEAWDRETCREAKRVTLLSRFMSEFTRGTWFSFFKAAVFFLWFNWRNKPLKG
ncbi:FAD binding domain protein [Cryphonectria parasitica EP155]|uniref:FAD binding domain protein n=1 Tax=Cryphonectria parasitica (strain ATCC 38755 / EP155) TaxID=660469 RepID=A0A9P4Y561_CRYP1|nr:FAD binding domain protein [Cryphonectria parasitica EP155]KAF3766876.1 FAD binding domain protein [Cryphonectria parasitica EP155]